ncbi:MAG TPA: GNAT family N-acetyltransferase [Streptosporangiaceae bacterium]|jgi:mycothiol synthase
MTDNGALGWRAIELGDVPEWAVMLDAVAKTESDPRYYGEQDLRELFGYPDSDFAGGSIAAFDEDAMVACAFLITRPFGERAHAMRLNGAVHPRYRRRGLGGRLLDWAEQAAIPLHERRHPGRALTLQAHGAPGNAGEQALFAAHGYRPVRWWNTMRMDLSAQSSSRSPAGVTPAPDGVEIEVFTPDRSEAARQVRNEAFQDHWGSTESSAESWAHIVAQESFRPEFSYVAYADGQAIGVVLSYEHEAATKATGSRDLYIGIVGTRRAGRNRGIASAMLSRALAAGRAAGLDTTSLLVDGDSLTGAVGLYERIGYSVEYTATTQAKDLITAG